MSQQSYSFAGSPFEDQTSNKHENASDIIFEDLKKFKLK